MYVCICNRYRDADIKALARQGIRCAWQAYSELGNGPQCGKCLEFAQDMIDTEPMAPVDSRLRETV